METVKGFRDIKGEEAKLREKIIDVIIKNFKLYGFEPAETPIVEYEEFVKGNNSNDDVISDIFKLQDKGQRKLALRYEFTFQLKRLAQNKKLPYKRYQVGQVFRDEPVSSNRFRQFTQCDVDVIGSTLKDEAELLSLAQKILSELGIKSVICVNSRKLLNEILEKEGIGEKQIVIKELDKLDKLTKTEVKVNLKKYKAEKILDIFAKDEKFFEKYSAYEEIKELKKYCSYFKTKVEFMPSLARGLSYYNGTIFEIKTSDIKETIAGGGSYLVNGIQSTGISFGLDRLTKITKLKLDEKRVLIISINQDKESVDLAEKLREDNVKTLIMYGKPSKALEYANNYNIPFVIFVGEEEIKKKKFKLRDMKTGKEEFLSSEGIIKKLKGLM